MSSRDILTERQLLFCSLLVADPKRNKTKAAIGAGCPAGSAAVQANKWLSLPKIISHIAALEANALASTLATPELRAKAEVDTEARDRLDAALDESARKVIEELRALAHVDTTAIFQEVDQLKPDGTPTGKKLVVCVGDPRTLPQPVRQAIKKWHVSQRVITRGDESQLLDVTYYVEFWDKGKALDTLAKYHKLLTDVVETRNLTVEDQLDLAEQQAKGGA